MMDNGRTISLRKAAQLLGVTSTYVYELERGRRCPSAEMYERMRKSGIYADDFFNKYEVITVQKVVLKENFNG